MSEFGKLNPDPKKYTIRMRRGKPLLVDKQIIRWRRARRKRILALAAEYARVGLEEARHAFYDPDRALLARKLFEDA